MVTELDLDLDISKITTWMTELEDVKRKIKLRDVSAKDVLVLEETLDDVRNQLKTLPNELIKLRKKLTANPEEVTGQTAYAVRTVGALLALAEDLAEYLGVEFE